MSDDENRKLFGVGGALLLSFGIPFVTFTIFNFMRPDLFQPMLDHVFGYAWVATITLLSSIAGTLYGFAFTLKFRSVAPRIVMLFCAVIFCTVPTVFAIVFGPIVFAFMYGNVH